jgi:hypothetical protein
MSAMAVIGGAVSAEGGAVHHVNHVEVLRGNSHCREHAVPDLPEGFGRQNHVAGAIGNTLLVAGGQSDDDGDDGGNPTASVLSLFLEKVHSATWTSDAVPDMPVARKWAAAVVAYGELYVSGGTSDDGGGGGAALDSVDVYSHERREWRAAAGMRTPRTHHCMARAEDRLVALGGLARVDRGGGGEPLASVETFDLNNNEGAWILIFGRRLRQPRYHHACATIVSQDDGVDVEHVLIAGGVGMDGQTLAAVELFNPIKRTFTSRADMLRPRRSFALAGLGPKGRLTAVGGRGRTTNEFLNECEVYSAADDAWLELNKVKLSHSRANFSVAQVNLLSGGCCDD